jgi:ABC-2 type transport system ATP-binding protein
MLAIETGNLRKSYGRREVLHGINLRVPEGELFGFLGPNGAGKSTAIRVLMGLLKASSGTTRVLGVDAWRDGPAARREIGYLPGDIRFYDNLTGRRTLEFLNAARGGNCGDEIGRLSRVFDLELDKRVRSYSRGMKQKLGLIQALMHRPKLLILDEPTTALDPLVRQTLYAELRAAAAERRTVLFSSHTLSEVEALCDEVAIVRDGHLIEHEKISVLRTRAVRRIEIAVRGESPLSTPPAGLRVMHLAGGKLSATWAGPVEPLLRWLAANAVNDVTIAPPDLEDLFMAYYAHPPEEAAA